MIVAGLGCRSGAGSGAVMAALTRALQTHRLTPGAVALLATGAIKRGEPAILAAAAELGLPLEIVEADALSAVAAHCLTHSPKSIAVAGTPSLSEAAALAAAGEGAKLLGPRIAHDGATCALARSEGGR